MKKILAFSGSNSSQSLNQQLAIHAAAQVSGHEVTVIDLRDFPMPLFGVDLEQAEGIPATANQLVTLITEHDGFIIAVPEHNRSVPAFFKNTMDWLSRAQQKVLGEKPVVLLATSPGRGGGGGALKHASDIVESYIAGKVVGTASVPSFNHATSRDDAGNLVLEDEAVKNALQVALSALQDKLNG